MKGYYNNTMFYRVIKNSIVQIGNPKLISVKSIYRLPFKNGYQNPLKFIQRGMAVMFNNQERNFNKQFCITLGSCNWKNKKHTVFGKITNDTIYKLLIFNEIKVDSNNKPV